MLRALVLGLVLANAGFFLWSQGHGRAWGLAPVEQREPERLQQQIAPERLQLLSGPRETEAAPAPDEAARAEEPAPPSTR